MLSTLPVVLRSRTSISTQHLWASESTTEYLPPSTEDPSVAPYTLTHREPEQNIPEKVCAAAPPEI